MLKYSVIALSLLLLVSCKKEILVFNGGPNEQLELPLILQLNGKDCFYDDATGLLKYAIGETALETFSPHTVFQEPATVLFAGKALKNHTANHLGPLELNKRYPLDILMHGQVRHLQLEFTDRPMVRIVTFDKIANEPKTLAKMTVNYTEPDKTPAVDWIGIEQRGASSLSFDKKSYGVGVYADKSTDHPVMRSYFGLQANTKWILDAMYVDKARCRNKASFSVWGAMGEAENHPKIRSVFVEVFLNNRSIGLYCLNENYSEELLGLQQQSVFYKGVDNSEVTFFNQLPGQEPLSARWAEWEQRLPDPSNNIVWDDFRTLSTLIVKGSDAEFSQSIGSLIDLENVMDYYLFVNLCGGTDNLGKNWHFLKRSPAGKFIIVPWDLDATWGRNAFGSLQAPNVHITNRLFERLKELNPGNYNHRLRQRWAQLRLTHFSQQQLFTVFSDNYQMLDRHNILEIENALWHQSLDLEQEQAYIKSWITARLSYLDARFE
jgi:spore coat protein H